jgi:hypothetical protein
MTKTGKRNEFTSKWTTKNTAKKRKKEKKERKEKQEEVLRMNVVKLGCNLIKRGTVVGIHVQTPFNQSLELGWSGLRDVLRCSWKFLFHAC